MNLHRTLARLAALLLAVAPLLAAAAAGEFTFVVGQVSIARAGGQPVAATKGTVVNPGDRIVTGADGMAQMTMVDKARLSLRPNTQFVVEQYPDRPDGTEGAVLNLVKGTLRTFTSLLSSVNRDRFVMKTRVATVGIRGSGNILYYCEGPECDESVRGENQEQGSIAVNHTIEGSHAVTNVVNGAPGVPAQQGGAQTLITGPGQTVLVFNNQPPKYIPTPAFIANAATAMTPSKGQATTTGEAARSYAPGEVVVLPAGQQAAPQLVGNNGLGFPIVNASGNLTQDPSNLRDIVVAAAGSSFAGQASAPDVTTEGDNVRGYRSYVPGGLSPSISGGNAVDVSSISLNGGGLITMGRWDGGNLSFGGAGAALPGGVHWIMAPSGYPMYLSDVLTGSASYTLAAHTAPTNQNNVAGTLGAANLDVNFNNRTLNFGATVSIPGTNAGGTWTLNAANVPIALNSFYGSTSDRLTITNGNGQSSSSNSNLSGSFQGSFVGTGLTGAILGYGISDRTSSNSGNWASVSGVAGFTGPAQDGSAPYREGRISDAAGIITDFIQSYATTDRPDEIVGDAQGRVTAFTAPYGNFGSHVAYNIGSAQVVESGVDPETGMLWGRWSGGLAQVNGQPLPLTGSSLHYIFAGTQQGPVALPLTGTATYDVIGHTSPTDFNGHVGALNSATLAANFTNRTADATVNVSINGQTWNGAASNMPIYRDQYFSAYAGSPIAGANNPSPLTISCTPNCGGNALGSFDGFFTGRDGNRAGLLYNMSGIQGAIAFGRRPGG